MNRDRSNQAKELLPRLTKAQCRALAKPFSQPWNRRYCYWKLRTDPVYPAAAAALLAIDDGVTRVLDVGCGLGLFARYLKAAGFRAPVIGVDYDGRKIRGAQQGSSGTHAADLQFAQADVRETLPRFRGHLTILDVLQYLDEDQRRLMLEAAVGSLAPRACLIIRSGLAERSWRFGVTRLADLFAHRCFWMKGPPVSYPDKAMLEDLLHRAGLQGRFEPLWGRTPFNNYLGVFRRSALAGDRQEGELEKREHLPLSPVSN